MATSSKNVLNITITEYSVSSPTGSTIDLTINDQRVSIPVSSDVKTYFKEQFSRPNPTPLQRKRFATLMNIVRAAYLKGLEDGSKGSGTGKK